MMYCRHCGKLTDENYEYCGYCGKKLDIAPKQENPNDSGSFGFGVLGFFFPIVGLILYLVFEGDKPKRAKAAGVGALTGFITGVVLVLLFVVLDYVFWYAILFSFLRF